MKDWCNVLPTETEMAEMVRNSDPAAMRWFGALLERTAYYPAKRTREQDVIDQAIRSTWPKFEIRGRQAADVTKACLWDAVVKTQGKHWSPMFQETGSCVGQGGGTATAYTAAVEAWLKGEPEDVAFPFFLLLPYGRSRHYIGERGPGEGSFGSAFARAIKEDGIPGSDFAGLPPYTTAHGGLTWGRTQELAWSYIPDAADKFDPFQDEAKAHTIRTVAQCKRADEVAAAIRNGYACTCASMWGGRMKCQAVSDPPVLLNEKVDQWAHQMSVLGWWEHPKLGEIFWIQNSWGNPHGDDPAGGPPGGFWIRKADMDWICRDEVFAFSSFDGFPARMISWGDILPRPKTKAHKVKKEC
jgi:hypothetical protein